MFEEWGVNAMWPRRPNRLRWNDPAPLQIHLTRVNEAGYPSLPISGSQPRATSLQTVKVRWAQAAKPSVVGRCQTRLLVDAAIKSLKQAYRAMRGGKTNRFVR